MVAYVRACFDLVNGCEDKEALGEYDRAEQGFVKALYTLAEAVMKRKECTVIYDFLSESGTLTNNRVLCWHFLRRLKKQESGNGNRKKKKRSDDAVHAAQIMNGQHDFFKMYKALYK